MANAYQVIYLATRRDVGTGKERHLALPPDLASATTRRLRAHGDGPKSAVNP